MTRINRDQRKSAFPAYEGGLSLNQPCLSRHGHKLVENNPGRSFDFAQDDVVRAQDEVRGAQDEVMGTQDEVMGAQDAVRYA